MTFKVEVLEDHPRDAAGLIAAALPSSGSVVLTGGTTAEKIYPFLALETGSDDRWSSLEVLFSDERCVPPDDPASNFKMATDILFSPPAQPAGARNRIQVIPKSIHRMRGEDEPEQAAAGYHSEIKALIDNGLDLVLLGMGADAHVGAMFPGSPALHETEHLCAAVDRPDGMRGLTLTPPAMRAGKKFFLLVTGSGKADTVRRVVEGDEEVDTCPARLLADLPDVTFLLDTDAASRLS